jgi:hypothetical protein
MVSAEVLEIACTFKIGKRKLKIISEEVMLECGYHITYQITECPTKLGTHLLVLLAYEGCAAACCRHRLHVKLDTLYLKIILQMIKILYRCTQTRLKFD